jgi:hypothetical protein
MGTALAYLLVSRVQDEVGKGLFEGTAGQRLEGTAGQRLEAFVQTAP